MMGAGGNSWARHGLPMTALAHHPDGAIVVAQALAGASPFAVRARGTPTRIGDLGAAWSGDRMQITWIWHPRRRTRGSRLTCGVTWGGSTVRLRGRMGTSQPPHSSEPPVIRPGALTGLVIATAGNSGQVYSDLIRNPAGGLPVLSRLDHRISAMKGRLYWSLVSMLAAVIIGALVVITSRALAGLMGPVGPIDPKRAAGRQRGTIRAVRRGAVLTSQSPAPLPVPPGSEC